MTARASFSRRSLMARAPVTAIGRWRKCRGASRRRRSLWRIGAFIRMAASIFWPSPARPGTISRGAAGAKAPRPSRCRWRGCRIPARAGSGRKIMEAATAVALIARHGHEAVLAQYLRLAPYGAESSRRRPCGALLFRQAGRGSLLGRDGAARRRSAGAGPHESGARGWTLARVGAGRARARRTLAHRARSIPRRRRWRRRNLPR